MPSQLVRVPSVRATSGTLGSVNESTATATSTGVFFGVLSGGTRPFLTPEGAGFYGVLRVDTRGTRAQGLDVTKGPARVLIGAADFVSDLYSYVEVQ